MENLKKIFSSLELDLKSFDYNNKITKGVKTYSNLNLIAESKVKDGYGVKYSLDATLDTKTGKEVIDVDVYTIFIDEDQKRFDKFNIEFIQWLEKEIASYYK